jgi:hypothetical protein
MAISQPPFQSTLVDANDRVQPPWAQWFSQLQPILQSVVVSGPTSGRPTQNLYIGYPYFDTTIDQMVYWNGVIWVTYAPSTTGTSILYGNGVGGFNLVSIGSGITFAGGVLSATGSGGTVTAVTGTAPIASSGGNTPVISISQSGVSSNGYLSSTDWNIFNSKAPATSGTAILYGDGTGGFSNVTIGSGVTFVAGTLSATGSGGTVTSVTGSGNIASSGGNTPNITFTGSLPIANGGTNGTATPTAGAVAVGNGTQYAFTAAGSAGQVLTSTGSTTPTWATVSTGIGTTGYWGSFWDTTNQTAASITSAYTINIGTSDPNNNGVSIVSSNQITVAHAGVYNIQYSIQFENIGTGNKNYNVDVWFRLNGVDIPDSNSTYWIASKNSIVKGELIAAVNYALTLNAGDYIQLMWAVSDVDISIATLPATSSPTVPRTPGVIVTVTPISEIGIGYYNLTSVSSVVIATGSKTFTTNLSNISTAFTVGTRVRVAYVTTPANYMEGVITSFSGTTLVVNVDSIGGSGTYANWTISVAGIQGSNGVTSITGTANQVIASASTGAVTLSLPQNINSGATPTFTGTNFTGIPNAGLTNSAITINGTSTSLGGSISVGTVTSAGFTGGLITVATATTTPAFTVAGTSGGIPYFSSASTWATSAALTANALMIGGGAGSAPATITTGTGVLTALGTNVGTAGAFVTFNGALGTPSSGTVTNLTGTASININGTVGATTANTGAFTTLSASSTFSAGTSTTDTAAFSGVIYRGTLITNDWVSINGTDPTTSTTSRGISFRGTFAATATGTQSGFFMSGVGASSGSAYTTTNVYGLQLAAYSLGVNQTVTNQYGVNIGAQPTATNIYSFFSAAQTNGTNNYAFYGNTASGTGRWNVYANGTAANYFNGNVLIGTTTQPATASNIVIAGLKATSAAAPTIASATTIAPTKQITFISGTTAIATITAPDPISTGGGQITLIPTGIFTTTTAGNIALASVAVVSKALIMTYDTTTAKWYPSY